jgi:uncharacterized membrane protein (UPF0127 family)
MQAYVIFADGTRVEVDVADTDAARERGLMFREALAGDRGMLFPFGVPRRYAMWMRNVRFALDILWLDRRGCITWIVENAPPCDVEPCPTYEPRVDAVTVLEVCGGFVRKHGVAIGDAITIINPPR